MAIISTRFERETLQLAYQILKDFRINHGENASIQVNDAYIALQRLLWPMWDKDKEVISAKDVDTSSMYENKSTYETYFNRYKENNQ